MVNAALSVLPRSRTSPIGLDVGPCGYRAAQLRSSGGRILLERSLCVERATTQPDASRTDGVLQGLRDDLRGAGFRGTAVVTTPLVAEPEFHLLELPVGVLSRPDGDVVEAIRWEVARTVGGSIDEFEIRHWVVPTSASGGPSVVAVSVRRQAVGESIDACRQAGLECRAVDVLATALCQFGCLLRRPDPRSVWGMLDLGHGGCRLVLCVDDVPVLVRNVGGGGQAWTAQIAESLQISPKAAEVHKRDHGISSRSSQAASDADVTCDAEIGRLVLAALRTELSQLAGEIKRSFEYVLLFHPQRTAVDLLLVGGGARLRELAPFLAGALGIPVRRASECLGTPTCRLVSSSGNSFDVDRSALAIGLAAWGESA